MSATIAVLSQTGGPGRTTTVRTLTGGRATAAEAVRDGILPANLSLAESELGISIFAPTSARTTWRWPTNCSSA